MKVTTENTLDNVTIELQPEEAERLAAILAFTNTGSTTAERLAQELQGIFPGVRGRWALKVGSRYVEPSLIPYNRD